jgi:alkylation response protein AidB-like acyl-CoA dehydrogenase
MDFKLSQEQEMMVDAARRMVASSIDPILKAHDPDTPLPKSAALEILKSAAEIGITAARVPESAGGAGLRVLDYGLICEQLPPIAAFIIQPQETTVTRLYFGSSPEQRERFLPDLIAAKRITCTATTEPDVGSDPRGVTTTAIDHGDHVVVNGRKMWISNASICDVVNVTCRDGGSGDARSLVRILVDRDISPFQSREIDVIGLRQSHLGEIVFENCRVPKINCFGQSGDAARILTLTWLANRPLLGLAAVHMAQKAFDMAREYAGVRKQFGRVIGAFQLIQQDLADIETAIVASRLLCYNALAAIDRGERANGLSAMAKRFAIETCDRAIATAMRVHGAIGLSRELGLERLARDVRMLSIPDGTSEILTLIQGREITGIDPFRPERQQ